ncbi:MAG: hypothetical protein BroJett025_05970 [Patescibacteria group bacterium]|nr:MAG: hypothetical protein BroJett025_05970 [Patescibacteria group bacterium]
MKKLLKSLLFGLAGFLFFQTSPIFASETINSFYSIIEINQDTSLTITEQIQYTTTDNRHGIYRYIPTTYNKGGQVERLPIYDVAVSDDQGNPIPFTRSSDGRFLTLKIGDPDTTFSGEKNYVITYTVERGINQFENHNELFWDITGEGWQIPIQKSSATVISQFAELQELACYSGPIGSDDGQCNFELGKNQATFTYLDQISYGDNMTIVVRLPKESQLQFPTQTELFFLWLKHNWPIVLLPVPVLVMFLWWYKKGRDFEFISQNVFDMDASKPARLRPVQFNAREPMVYEPLKDITPGESGALLDERVDIQDIVAEILELARKKKLKISVTEKKVLFSITRDYEFTKLSENMAGLSNVQAYLFTELFKTGDVVQLSKLKGTFYLTIDAAKGKLESALVEKKAYTDKPMKVRALGLVIFIILLAGVFWVLSVTVLPLGIVWPVFLLVLQFPVGMLLGYNLPQKTAVGTNLCLQARGLRATINRGAWREKIKEKHLFIEEVLPFAVSLGVVKQLAKDMEELQIKPPEYISTAHLATWTVADFVSGFSTEVGNSLAYNPNSSSSSGGSGFSGGSSGGGGGGGGGGSW